jgi:GntR family transcriptional regulator
MLELNRRSSIPLRVQVEQLLREMVRRPEYQSGNLLPNEEKLAAQLGISRGTVRAGISRLVFEGVLERKAGVGTRASNRHLDSGISAWHSFTREMAAKGIAVQNFQMHYSLTVPSTETVQALQLNSAAPIWRLDRVRGWDGKPVLQATSWFHPRLNLKGNEDFTKPLYETLENETNVRAHHAHEEFLATIAEDQTALLLQIPVGTPLQLRRHTVFDSGNRPFEFAEIRYVSSRFTLTMELQREEK